MKEEEKKEAKKKPNKDNDEFTRGILSLPQLVKKLLVYALDEIGRASCRERV